MSLPELLANSPIPGTNTPIAILAAAVTSTVATTITTGGLAPAALQGSGQFRIIINGEIMIVTGGANTTTWTVTRGAEGSTAATHVNSSPIFHYLTVGGLIAAFEPVGSAASEATRALAAEALMMRKANNLSDVASISTARTNLGLGTAATQSSSAFDAAGAASGLVAIETARAIAAEVTKAPVSSPTFTGTPRAPTPTASDNSTKLATTAYVDAATSSIGSSLQRSSNLSDLISVTAARTNLGLGSAATQPSSAFDAAGAAATVQTASLQKASNLSDLANVVTARGNLGLGSAATQASSAFDAAGAAATAQTTAQASSLQKSANLSDLVNAATARANLGLGTAATQAITAFDTAGLAATETTRATTAEALLAPLASPTLTGTPRAPTQAALDNSTKIATTAYTNAAVAAATTTPSGAAGGDLSGTFPNPGVAKLNGVAASAYALLASPTFTGTPHAPTPTALDNSTKLATTAYADVAIAVEKARALLAEAKGGLLTQVSIGTASPYSPNPGEMVNVDTTSGGILLPLPSGPADGTRIGVHMEIGVISTPATIIIQAGAGDTFTNAGTTRTLDYVGQMTTWVYVAADHTWRVWSAFMPLSGLDQRYLPLDSPSATGVTSSDQFAVNAIPGLSLQTREMGTLLAVGVPGFTGDQIGDIWYDFTGVRYMWTGAGWITPDIGSAPLAQIDPVTSFTATTATVTGEVTSNAAATTYQFQLGTDGIIFGTVLPSSPGNAGSGTTPVQYSANFTGLTANTTYYVQLVTVNATGTTTSSVVSFTTTSASPAPTVTVGAVTALSQSIATLNGTVNPNSSSTSYAFHYGTTSGTYPNTAGSGSNSGGSPVTVAPNLTGLTANTKYYYVLTATSVNGTTSSAEASFTTTVNAAKPIVTTGAVSSIGTTTATAAQFVDPNGFSSTATLNYGLTSAYGSSIGPTAPFTGGNQSISTAITGLSSGTTYHFSYTATNSQGTTIGPDQTFTTLVAPTAPANAGGGSAPAISGGSTVGVTVTCSQGTWTGTTPITYTFQWKRNGTNITGETNQTYVTQSADAGTTLTCTVTATNGVGNTSATSAGVAITAGGGAPTPISPPVVT